MKFILFTGAAAIGWFVQPVPAASAQQAGSPYDPPGLRARASGEFAATGPAPFRDALMPPLSNWKGHVFRLSQDYPASIPADSQPWLAYDPLSQPASYIQAVLAYFYQGNLQGSDEVSFDPALNPVRKWYNAPWQDYGINGREFVHGLTRERPSEPGELSRSQQQYWSNYAVGYYNAPGGYILGQIWADPQKPAAALASMPEGTVAAKLLFTTAPVTQVPYLAGAPQWQAYVYQNPNDRFPTSASPRSIQMVSLLQIDVAVKDHRSGTGWVFGTFVYGGGPNGPEGSGWTNVAPVGLMWGNDPGYSGQGPLNETWLNQPAVNMLHYGYQNRLNGPVDNPASSCLSCHATAERPPAASMIPKDEPPDRWFQNIPSGTPFDPGHTPLDYSLQVQFGLQNFDDSAQVAHAPTPAARRALVQRFEALDEVPPRDGGGR